MDARVEHGHDEVEMPVDHVVRRAVR